MDKELEDRIRTRAHQIWENEGRPTGRDLQHWVAAKKQIESEERATVEQRQNQRDDQNVGQQPEALATFAKASRNDGKKPVDLGLSADKSVKPIRTSSELKDEAATKVLQEGVEHQDKGSRKLIDELPDRITESRSIDHNIPDSTSANTAKIQTNDTREGYEGQGDRRKP